VFQRLLSGLTGGGIGVETLLDRPDTTPGGTVTGVVHLTPGDSPADLERVVVSLVTRVEVESGDSEWSSDVEFGHVQVAGAGQLAPGNRPQLRFTLPVPLTTPVTAIGGQRLRRPTVGVRTDVSIARAMDKGDLDPLVVHALPAQEQVLAGLSRLGFAFKGADVERGRVPGSALPFYQEFEFYPSREYARAINELEVTLIPKTHGLQVLLEADRRGGFFTEGYDSYAGFEVNYAQAESTDWDRALAEQISSLGRRRGLFG